MAESANQSKENTTPASGHTSAPSHQGPEFKQMESQLVSLNFVLKNTQSEVIKLQKALSRYQSRQDEYEKKSERLERDLSRVLERQKEDSKFRSRVWFYQVCSVLITLLLFMLLSNAWLKPGVPSETRSTPDNNQSEVNRSTE